MGSSNSSSFSLKILLISIGVLTAATAFNFFLPAVLNFIISDIPVIWSVILSWLKPPYLYFVINGIIITIAATSRLNHHYNHHHHYKHEVQSPTVINELDTVPPPDLISTMPIDPMSVALEHSPVVFETETEVSPVVFDQIELPVVGFETVSFNGLEDAEIDSVDKFVVTKSTWNYPAESSLSQSEFVYPASEKPLVKSRFANQRKKIKPIAEGVKSLKVAKPKKHETLETTWKTITDGRHMPLNRHLRKSDTFENHHHHHSPLATVDSGEQVLLSTVADYNMIKKFETFNDRTNHLNHRVVGKLRKEGSPSQDELNRRVEAFIKKFNDEMRLQRQESLQRYKETVNRGPG